MGEALLTYTGKVLEVDFDSVKFIDKYRCVFCYQLSHLVSALEVGEA